MRYATPITAVPMTIACRAYAIGNGRVIGLCNSGNDDPWLCYLSRSGGNISMDQNDASGGGYTQFSGGSFPSGTWVHLAGKVEGNASRTVYVDGAGTFNSTNKVPATDLNNLCIAVLGRPSITEYFGGAIAEVGVWDVGLTDAEVLSLSNGACPLLIRPQSIVFYDPLPAASSGGDLVGGRIPSVATGTGALHPRVYGY